MSRFIFTNTDSGAGCLKQARIADRVFGLGYDLVHGPAPYTIEPLDFFLARTAFLHLKTDDWEVELTEDEIPNKLAKHASTASEHDQVELWIDPTPNAQLQLLQVLDWFRTEQTLVNKLFVVHVDRPLGVQTPEWVAKTAPRQHRADEPMFAVASACWLAYRQQTPQDWFDLLSKTLRILPYLQAAVHRILLELPDAETGLMETQRRILSLISRGADTPLKLLSHISMLSDASVFGYWRHCQILVELTNCSQPALAGLVGADFTLAVHENESRHKAFMRSRLTLTDFGRELLASKNDFARYNPIDRWWGGTRLTNSNLWRWNSATNSLVTPS